MRKTALVPVLACAFALGVGYGVGISPLERASDAVHAAEPIRPRADAPMAFLQDGEPYEVQKQQLAVFNTLPVKQRWHDYIAPYLASQGVADAAVTAQSDAPPTPAELEAFRARYATFAADTQRLLDLIPAEQRMDIKARVAAAQLLIPDMSYDQLAALKDSFTDYPGFWSTPTWAANTLARSGHVAAAQALPGGPAGMIPLVKPTVPPSIPQFPSCKEFGGDPNCGDCPAAPAGGDITIAVLNSLALAGTYGCQFIPPDLLAGTTSFPNPVNVICVGVRVGLELAAAAVTLANDLAGECAQGVFYGTLTTYLDTTVSSRASQQSHNFHRAWNIRTDIEDNLLDLLDTRISTFQLPVSQNGYLNRTDDLSVDWIVDDTISLEQSAGYDVRNAQAELSDARTLLTTGDYKNAYARYRKAYRAAVRVGRELSAVPWPP
ncbi:MAG: hypothetical protein ABI780_06860 [Ardenticatenales bacterium]